VNEKVVKEPYYDVKKEDEIFYRGKKIKKNELVYICLNKPAGYVSTLKDRYAEKKVIDLIPEKYGRVFPAGRLDKDATGLLILTNDGNFANFLTHPRYQIEKEYEVVIDGILEKRGIEIAKKGVFDKGERLKIIDGKIVRRTKKATIVRIILKEGKKREIKRIFKVLGYNVLKLKRIRIGNIKLGNLKEGDFKIIFPDKLFKKDNKH